MRVIAGRFGGRRLREAPRSGVRPTSDRVRESLFAWLGDVEGASVLDAYAGTGALGIEALSRGARRVVFVERSPAALSVLRRNLGDLGLGASPEEARVVRGEALRTVRRLGRAGERFDLVLLDPPYASGELPGILEALVASGVLVPDAEVVVEASRRHPLPRVGGLAMRAARRYGDTQVGRYAPAPEAAPAGPGAPEAAGTRGPAGDEGGAQEA